MYYVPESLFEWIRELLLHWLDRCPIGACIGAMTQAWILRQNPQRLLFGHTERPVEPTLSTSTPSVLSMVPIFLQWTSNGYVALSTLYMANPWLIYDVFDALNT